MGVWLEHVKLLVSLVSSNYVGPIWDFVESSRNVKVLCNKDNLVGIVHIKFKSCTSPDTFGINVLIDRRIGNAMKTKASTINNVVAEII